MTTKPGDTIQPLDLDDLDQVVGGVGMKLAQADHDHAPTSDFLASLHDASAAAEAGDHRAGFDHPSTADQPHDHRDLATAQALALDAAQAPPDAASHRHAVLGMNDPLTYYAAARMPGPEASHQWLAARESAASVGAHPAVFGFDDGDMRQENWTAITGWDGDLAHHLFHDGGSQHSFTAEEMSQDALRWETRFLDDAVTVGETIQATAPDFLAQTQHLFADPRQALQAIFAAPGAGGDYHPLNPPDAPERSTSGTTP